MELSLSVWEGVGLSAVLYLAGVLSSGPAWLTLGYLLHPLSLVWRVRRRVKLQPAEVRP